MSRTYGYCRVSTLHQAEHGQSLEAQEHAIGVYAAAKGLGTPTFFVDGGESGKVPFAEREAGNRLLRDLKGGDHVVCTKIDRFGRNMADFVHYLHEWQKRDVSLHVISEFGGLEIDPRTPMGRFLAYIIAAVAEMRREQIREATRETFAYMRSKGEYGHLAPRGFKSAKARKGKKGVGSGGWHWVPDPEARALMGQMLDWYDAGKSCIEIGDHLVKSKVKTVGKVKEWNRQNVWNHIVSERALREKERGGQAG